MEQIVSNLGKWGSSVLSYAEKYTSSYRDPRASTTVLMKDNKPYTKKRRKVYCGICENEITEQNDPRVLICGHPFCYNCLSDKAYAAVIKCPQCNQAHLLSSEDQIDELEKLTLDEEEDIGDGQFDGERKRLSSSFEDVDLKASGGRDDTSNDDESQDTVEEKQEDDFVLLNGTNVNVIPDFYIPFTQSKELYLDQQKVIHDFNPVYVPFYSFTIKTKSSYKAEVATSTDAKGNLTWEEVSGKFSTKYEELMTCATYSVNIELVMALLNKQGSFSLNTEKKLPPELRTYSPDLKFQERVLPIDIRREDALHMAGKKNIYQLEESKAKSIIKETHKAEQMKSVVVSTKLVKLEYITVLLPIYLTGFTYRDSTYEVVISGNKGVVEGYRPYGSGLLGKLWRNGVQKVKSVYTDNL